MDHLKRNINPYKKIKNYHKMNWPWKKKCEHDYKFVRNIYGDEINSCGKYRSIWKCKKCGKYEYRKYIQHTNICKELEEAYDNYYKNKYEKWCEEHLKTLNFLSDDMMQAAQRGECWDDFILICEESSDDKYYYEKWFNENNLEVSRELDQKEECLEVNKYKFHVRWKYK